MGMPRWNLSDTIERKIRLSSLVVTALIIFYELLNGDISTQFPAMYLCVFVFPAVYFTNKTQDKYFPLLKEYVQATRIVAIFMTLASLCVWGYATYLRLSIPPMPSHLIYNM